MYIKRFLTFQHLSSPTPTGAVVELPRSGVSQASAAVSLPNVMQNSGGVHSDVLEAPAAPPLAFKAAAPLQQPKRLPIGSLGGAGRGVNLDQEVDHDSQVRVIRLHSGRRGHGQMGLWGAIISTNRIFLGQSGAVEVGCGCCRCRRRGGLCGGT